MKKLITAITAALLLCLGLTAPAWAADQPCVPKDAWTETIPAVGEPTLPNPDYEPAWTEDVEHEAEYKTVHHDAEYKTAWKYVKHGGSGEIWVDNDTFKYVDELGNGFNKKPQDVEYYERTQKTRTETTKDAYDEQVLVKDAWTETVEHDAVGEETIPNKDYVPEDTIEHPAVVCDVDPTVPTSPRPPAEVEGPNQVDVEYACDDVTVMAYTMRTTTTPYIWDAETQNWVLDFDNQTNEDERTVVNEAPVDCGGPTDPAPESDTETNIVDREYACDGITVVAFTEQTITTPYVWDEELQDWVLDFDSQTTTENRVVVDDENVDCGVITPTPEKPTKQPDKAPVLPGDTDSPDEVKAPTPAPAAESYVDNAPTPYYYYAPRQANTLPQTGADVGPLAAVGAILLVFGGILMFISRKHRS